MIERGFNLKGIRLIVFRPLGIIRRIILKHASRGQVLVSPTRTWTFQRNYFFKSLEISLALDVGGNLGQWALEVRNISQAKIITFEPDPRCIDGLIELSQKDPFWKIVEMAAGNSNSFAYLNLLQKEHGYSSLKNVTELGEKFSGERNQDVKTTQVKVGRLDSYFTSETIDNERVWLKIDVQGFEIEVLEGANEILSKIIAVEIEIPMLSLYENSEKFSKIVKMLEDHDFVICSIFSERWSKVGVADCDALFVKNLALNEIML